MNDSNRADLRHSLRDLQDDIERARNDLRERSLGAIPAPDIEDFIIRDQDSKPTAFDVAELKALVKALDSAADEIGFAFKEFDEEIHQALKTFKQQCLREVMS
jgi:hypothetical protein